MGISQKTPFSNSINAFANRKINDNQQSLGQALPCHVVAIKDNMVTVNFDVLAGQLTFPPVTCSIAESKYVRLPIQIGDQGFCITANARLGEITGLGLGKAPLIQPSNLGGLVFVPISNTNWENVDNNALNLSGLNGVVMKDTGNKCTLTLLPTGVNIKIGTTIFNITGNAVNITATTVTINGKLQVNGTITSTDVISTPTNVFVGNIGLATHIHGGVTRGGFYTDTAHF